MDHTINEAIILAGGLGTRLRPTIGELPKPMAPIDSKPFLDYILDFLIKNGIQKVILSTGYKSEIIESNYKNKYKDLSIQYSVETEPLGTGGAIKQALKLSKSEVVYILNGDTFFDINLLALHNFHFMHKGTCSIALKSMQNIKRYGSVDINDIKKIQQFNEKKPEESALINGGIYLVNTNIVNELPTQNTFSFEADYLEKDTAEKSIYGLTFSQYFVDIGIPEDYESFIAKVKREDLPLVPLNNLEIDKSWTLFLDRDGVINHQIINEYVKQVHELKIIDGVPEAISDFTKQFGRIVIVTNQQGIGKRLMTVDDLNHLNGFILNLIETYEGKIDKIYFAPQLVSENNNYRKPGTGMGLHAQIDFPEIDFKKSVLIGDSEGDIEFGTKLGMKTIMLKNSRNLSTKANYIFENLQEVARHLRF